jgi:hypothetical protein
MIDTPLASDESGSIVVVRGWPRWTAAALTITGLIVIFVETTSLLLFAGLLLVGLGIYGFVVGARARPLKRDADASSSGISEQEVSTHGS